MNVLITGASGFTGFYLIRHLLSHNEGVNHIWGLSRRLPLKSHAGFTAVRLDLSNKKEVEDKIDEIKPDAIIHLAGQNHGDLPDLMYANVVNTGWLLDAVRKNAPESRVLVIGSSAEYGYAGNKLISEDTPLQPTGVYGVTKVAQDILALQYYRAYNLKVSVARPFNLIGPGQPDTFICGKLVKQALEIRAGKRICFECAGGNTRRDFIDVRDVVDAYWKLISHPHFTDRIAGNTFNIGSGSSYSISELIHIMSEILGKTWPCIMGEMENELIPSQITDITRLTSEIEWKPSFTIHQSIKDMMETI
ncbi:hypothetical protein RJ53_04675 [Methanocalculus chunghsingensis]|uniref:NAD-dependent epimerase/dehydratase domain-containing protein n=1 Tax=Methanocalculus chunghsingensis TaxID=156457 RepID=A0A8J7W9Z1_9EURY|nr:GDP-mannose 4,6-dehydratase [Methanocalculus chunghsingensis]MBR1368842.1 hypothetical protein [Methanocalculus chunghsingensis]